ncbi:MAG: hypothetical protein H7844_04235 [Nitrospirae bacterium YQR-1]
MIKKYVHLSADINSVVRVTISLLLLFIILPKRLFYYQNLTLQPWTGVDVSWQLALNLAVKMGLTFGKDIIFTHGPLGFLTTHVSTDIDFIIPLAFSILLVLISFIMIHYIVSKLNSYSEIFFVLVLFFTSCVELLYTTYCFLLLVIVFFLFRSLYDTQNTIKYLWLSGAIVIILFYEKVYLALFSLAMYYSVVAYMLSRNRAMRNKILLCVIIHILAVSSISVFLKVDILNYIIGSISISDSYNDVMFRKSESFKLYAAVVYFVFLLTLFPMVIKNIKRHVHDFVAYLVILLSCFFLFKQSFVRFGSGNEFFSFVVLFIALFYIFTSNISIERYMKVVLPFLIVLILIVKIQDVESLPHYVDKLFSLPYKDVIYNKLSYDRKQYLEENKPYRTLPDNIIRLIDKQSVDIMPWEISYIYFNGLNYNPRPIIQSYTAYNSYLDKKNAEKYAGPSAPQFVIYSSGSLDGRHPFWDETYTKLTLLQNYSVVSIIYPGSNQLESNYFPYDTEPKMLLFSKNKVNTVKTIQKHAGDVTMKFGEKLLLAPVNNILLAKIKITYTFLGYIIRTLYKPPVILALLTYDDGVETYYRASIPILENGVILNKRVISTDDALNFFTTNGKGCAKVVSLEFILTGPDKFKKYLVKDKINIAMHEIDIIQGKENVL